MKIKETGISKTMLVPVILAGSVIAALVLVLFKQSPPKAPPASRAPLVEIIEATPTTRHITLSGFGTVTPKRRINIRAQVSGRIVEVHPEFQEGGRIKKGETILKIDPRDYEVAVKQAEAALARAEFELKIEQGSQVVAKREWELLDGELKDSPLGEELALRKPHLLEKKAALEGAKGQLEKAKLDLERTNVTAPFDLIIVERSAELGKYVNNQTELGRIAGTETFQVIVKLPRKDLDLLVFEGNSDVYDNRVKVFQTLSDKQKFASEGRLVRFLGNVDQTGRMAQVLVEIENPLDPTSTETPLLIGSYVKVEFKGSKVSNVYQIPRNALRAGSLVWAVDNGKLKKIEVEEVFSENDSTYVRGSLGSKSLIITSSIKTVLNGMEVRIFGAEASKNEGESEQG